MFWKKSLRRTLVLFAVFLAIIVSVVLGIIWLYGSDQTTLRGHQGLVTSIAFSSDGRFLVSSSTDTTVLHWDLDCSRRSTTVFSGPGIVNAVSLSQDGSTIGVATNDGESVIKDSGIVIRAPNSIDQVRALLIDAKSKNVIRRFTGHHCSVSCLTFAMNGKALVTGGTEGIIRFHSVENGHELFSVDTGSNTDKGCIRFGEWFAVSPDGRFVAAANWRKLDIFDIPSGEKSSTFEGHNSNIASVAISPDSSAVVTASNDGTVIIWDVLNRNKKQILNCQQPQITAVRLSPDGGILAVASMNKPVPFVPASLQESARLTFFDAKEGVQVATYDVHVNGRVCLAFSPNARTVSTGGIDGLIKLWRVPSVR